MVGGLNEDDEMDFRGQWLWLMLQRILMGDGWGI